MSRYWNRRIITIFLMGFSSGLPIGLVGTTLQAWYTVSGASLLAIGWLTMIGQPYAYKFLWAPFLDRFCLWPFVLGRRRSWIIGMQGLLALSLLLMSLCHPASMPLLLAFIALTVAIFSATQDTAIDAYRTELLAQGEQSMGVSANTIAYRLAMIVSGAFAFILAAWLGWQWTYFLMAMCFVVMMGVTYFSPDPVVVVSTPLSMKEAVISPFVEFFSRKQAILLLFFIVLYKLTDAMALSLNTTFLIRGMGFSLIQIGAISKTVGLAAALLGSLAGGFLLPYLSLYRSLLWFGWLQLSSNLLYAWLYVVGKNITVMSVAIFGENFCGGLSTIAFVVFLMRLCNKQYTATQYALFSAFAALGRIFIGPLSAVLVKQYGWMNFYVMTAIIGVPSLGILYLLQRTQASIFCDRVKDIPTITEGA